MFYRVKKDFTDLQDNNHVYRAGDVFPRKGVEVDNARYLELSTTANRRNEALIEAVGEVADTAPKDEIQPEKGEIGTDEVSVSEVKKAPRTARKKKEK